MEDIRNNILNELDDIDDIKSICLIDNRYYKLCVSKNFWNNFFQKHQLILRNDINHNTLKDWIDEYYKTYIFKNIKMLEDQTVDNLTISDDDFTLIIKYKDNDFKIKYIPLHGKTSIYKYNVSTLLPFLYSYISLGYNFDNIPL